MEGKSSANVATDAGGVQFAQPTDCTALRACCRARSAYCSGVVPDGAYGRDRPRDGSFYPVRQCSSASEQCGFEKLHGRVGQWFAGAGGRSCGVPCQQKNSCASARRTRLRQLGEKWIPKLPNLRELSGYDERGRREARQRVPVTLLHENLQVFSAGLSDA